MGERFLRYQQKHLSVSQELSEILSSVDFCRLVLLRISFIGFSSLLTPCDFCSSVQHCFMSFDS